MSTPTVFHYPNCSTCRKARKWLEAQGVEHELVDIVESPPSAKVLKSALAASGLPVKRFFNTSGQSYRNGGFKETLPGMSDAEAIAALAADGKLIKRPLVIAGDTVLVGFREPEWAEVFG